MPVALRVEPRVYPAGRALSLVAVGGPELAGRRFVVEGRRVQGVRLGRLGLALAYVDAEQYAEESIARHREQPGWLRTEARIHERAVTKAATFTTVIPAPLLGVYPDPRTFERAAAERYPRWSRALARIGAQQEFALHVFFGPHAPPGGEPYLLRVAERVARSGRVGPVHADPRIVEHVAAVQRACGSSNVRRLAADHDKHRLFAAVLLCDDARLAGLREALTALAPGGADLGLTYYLEGPRPAFSFV